MLTRQSAGWLAPLVAIALSGAWPVAAQDSRFGTGDSPTMQAATSGWSATPSLVYSGSWDDNVLFHGRGDASRSDFLNVLNPRGDLEFNGKRTQFSGTYDGAFLLYRELNTLDSYDQRGSVSVRRLLSRHLTLFAGDGFAIVPTTELAQLVGIPFLRTGSRVSDFRGGIEAALTKRFSITTSYQWEWVRFDELPAFPQLRGGHSQGGLLGLNYKLSSRTALLADADFEHAIVGIDEQTFDVMNAGVGVEHTLTDTLKVSGEVGVSRLGVTELGPARTGPMVRARLLRQFHTAGLDVGYSRSFVPAYGFGGTTDNKELTIRLRLTLSHRIYSQSSLSWRSNDPLTPGALSLRSWWGQASVGYAVQPWVHLEGFYGGLRQTIDRPGGELERNRFGFQIVTSRPVRIR
jgi:hypothetical protein